MDREQTSLHILPLKNKNKRHSPKNMLTITATGSDHVWVSRLAGASKKWVVRVQSHIHTHCTPRFCRVPFLGFTPSPFHPIHPTAAPVQYKSGAVFWKWGIKHDTSCQSWDRNNRNIQPNCRRVGAQIPAPTHQPALIYSLRTLCRMTCASHLDSSCAKRPGGEKGVTRQRKKRRQTNRGKSTEAKHTLYLTCSPPCSFKGIHHCSHRLSLIKLEFLDEFLYRKTPQNTHTKLKCTPSLRGS